MASLTLFAAAELSGVLPTSSAVSAHADSNPPTSYAGGNRFFNTNRSYLPNCLFSQQFAYDADTAHVTQPPSGPWPAAGDTAFITALTASGSGIALGGSGWSLVSDQSSASHRFEVFARTLTAADLTTTFTYSVLSPCDWPLMGGFIVRSAPLPPLTLANAQAGPTTSITSPSLGASAENNLLTFFAGTGSVADDFTFTPSQDVYADISEGGGSSIALGASQVSADGSTVPITGSRSTAGDFFALSVLFRALGQPVGGAVTPAEAFGGSNPSIPAICVCRRQRAEPIDTADGNFWHTWRDLAIPGRGPQIAFSRTYNSMLASTDSGLGFGWSFPYGMSLAVNGSAVTVTQENGSQVAFTQSGSTYTAGPQVIATLAHNADGTWTFTRRAREIVTFDSTGRLTSLRDLNGYATTVSYPPGQQVITDAAGRSLTLSFTGTRVTSLVDSASPARGETFSYDGAGNLTDVVDVGGGHWQYTYDGSHRLLTIREPRYFGDTTTTPTPVTTNHYDAQGRVDAQTDPLGHTTTFDYTTLPGSTIVTDPDGNKIKDSYNSGLLQSTTEGYGTSQAATWSYSYDVNSLERTAATDPNQHTSTATFDASGNRLTATDALNRTTTWTYDSLNDVLTVQDPAGVKTTNTYDAAGNLLITSTPTSKGTVETQYFYDDTAHPGDLTRVIDPDGKTWHLGYDTFGMLTSKTDPLGHGPSWAYDGVGRIVSSTTGENKTTTYVTDAFGRVTQTTDALTHTTRTVYDGNGNVTDTYDQRDRHTHTGYNPDNQPTLVTRNDGTTRATSYDANGNVTSQTDGTHQPTTYTFDALNHVSKVTDPNNRATQYAYDAAGNLRTVTKPDGVTITRGYDAANELTSLSYSDATPNVTKIGYDADGRRTSMTDGTGTSSWSYDELGHLVSHTNGAHQTVQYGYDLAGYQTTLTYPDGTVVTRTYDDAGYVTAVDDGHGHVSHFGYDHADALTSTQYANGITATTTVDALEQPTSITDANGATTVATFGTTRWEDERVKTVSATGAVSSSDSYGYTPIAQLASTNTGNYSYDTADNLTGLADGTLQTFDAANELTSTSRINLVGTSTGGDAGTSATATVTAMPGGQRAGDLVLFAVTYPGSATISTAPSGYTQVGTPASTGTGATSTTTVLYRRIATGNNETPPTLTFSLPTAKSVVLTVYHGVDATTPIDASAKNAQSASTTLTLPSLTPTSIGERAVMVFGATGNAAPQSWTRPAFTGEVAAKNDQPLTSLDMDEKTLLTGTAPTGTFTGTFANTSAVDLAGIDVLLKPAITTYGYDANGNRTRVTPPTGGTSTYGYDAENRLVSYTAPGVTATYSYDGTGLRATKIVNGGAAETFQWDQSTSVPRLLVDGAVDVIYGPDGLPLEHYVAPAAISLVGTGTGGDAGGSTTAAVNLPAHQRGDLILVATVTTANSTVSTPAGYTAVANFTGTSPNQVTQAPQETVFRRIADGTETSVVLTYSQPLAKGAVAAIYRSTDQDFPIDVVAAAATNASGTTLNLNAVNARRTGDLLVGIPAATGNVLAGTWTLGGGLTSRVQKTDNPLSNIALGDQALTTTGLTGIRPTSTDQTGQLIGISLTLSPNPDVMFYQHDQQGSTRILTDQFARVRATYNYDPYGRLLTATGNYGTLLRYTGEYSDPETGLYYLRARYYDPATALFLTRDPITAVTREAYGYAVDDPANVSDPLGLCGWSDPFGCVSDAASSVGGAVDTAASDVAHAANAALPVVHVIANGVALVASACAVVTSATIIGGVTCGGVALAAGGVSAATGGILYAEGKESGVSLTLDVGGLGLSGVGSLAEAGAAAAETASSAADTASFLGRARYELWEATANGLAFASRAVSVEGFGFGLYGTLCNP